MLSAFRASEDRISVADIDVPEDDIQVRLAIIRLALIAHAALNTLLTRVGVDEVPTKMIDAISKGESLQVVTFAEGRVLRQINSAANNAKHRLPRE